MAQRRSDLQWFSRITTSYHSAPLSPLLAFSQLNFAAAKAVIATAL